MAAKKKPLILINQKVESSNILTIDYDGVSTLRVRFSDGARYRYFLVPSTIVEGLLKAGSKGKFFHQFIKDKYDCEKEGDMPVLKIILDGDSCWPDLNKPGKTIIHHTDEIQVAVLGRGMASGKPSVSIRIDIDSKTSVIAETSLALLLTAADAFKAKYGDPRK